MSKRVLDLTMDDDVVMEKKEALECCVCHEAKLGARDTLCQPGFERHGVCAPCLVEHNQHGGNFKCPFCKVDMRVLDSDSPTIKELLDEHTPFERLTTLWSTRRGVLNRVVFSTDIVKLPENTAFLRWMIEHEYKTDPRALVKNLFEDDDTINGLLFRKDSERAFNHWLLNESCVRAVLQLKEVESQLVSRAAIASLRPWALDFVSPEELTANFVGAILMRHSRATYEWATLVWQKLVRFGEMINYTILFQVELNNCGSSEVLCFIGSKLADKARVWKDAIARNTSLNANVLMALVHSWRPLGGALEYPLLGSRCCVAEFSSNLLIRHDGEQFIGPVGRCFTEQVKEEEGICYFGGGIQSYLTIATDPLADSKSPVIITYPSVTYTDKELAVVLLPDKRIHLLVSIRVNDIADSADLLYRSIARPEDNNDAAPYHPIIEIGLNDAAVYRFADFTNVKVVDLRKEAPFNWPVFKRSF